MEKIKIIIADNNKIVNENIRINLEKKKEIEILGCAYSDEDEINLIDKLKPEIVITNLFREEKLSGLEIINKYKKQNNSPKFLVITGTNIIDTSIMDGFISKPFVDYDIIFKELKNIKKQIIYERNNKEQSKATTQKSNKLFGKILKKIKNKE